MTTATDVLSVARSQLGYQEVPDNQTKFGAWFGMNGGAWCDMFQSWCGQQAGCAAATGHFAYCPSHVAWFRGRGQWGSTPKVGALVFFSWSNNGVANHVGIVEQVRGDGSIVTIEGNTGPSPTGGGVYRMVRRGNILGYGYPAYDNAGPGPAPAPPPPPAPAPGQLAVDGVPGPQTYMALQRAVGVPADGELGPVSWRAIQARCGATADGQPGPNTWQAVQRHVGAPADGQPGPVTWRAVQSALNAGRF